MSKSEQDEEPMRDSKRKKKINKSVEILYHKKNTASTTNLGELFKPLL